MTGNWSFSLYVPHGCSTGERRGLPHSRIALGIRCFRLGCVQGDMRNTESGLSIRRLYAEVEVLSFPSSC